MRRYYSTDLTEKGFGNSENRSKANSRNGIINIFQIMDNA
jgi:hypothetical protein